jgi:hypothetical protein
MEHEYSVWGLDSWGRKHELAWIGMDLRAAEQQAERLSQSAQPHWPVYLLTGTDGTDQPYPSLHFPASWSILQYLDGHR